MSTIKKPSIIIPYAIRTKIQFIVDNCDKEVSGLGTVIFSPEENAYRVTDILLLDQEVGSAHTDLDDDAVAMACYQMRDCEGDLAFWWHSHVNMATFWSSTDHDTMDKIGTNGLCVACVFNKKEEVRGAIVIAPENYPKIKLDDVEVIVEHEYSFDSDALLEEIKQKVRTKTYAPMATNTNPSIMDRGIYLGDYGKDYDSHFLEATKQEALDAWSKLTKEQRIRYNDFKDFHEDYLWDEHYISTGKIETI